MKQKYVIRINDGFYGKIPFSASPIEDAHIFDKMKDARKALNRLEGRLMKDFVCAIVPYIEK